MIFPWTNKCKLTKGVFPRNYCIMLPSINNRFVFFYNIHFLSEQGSTLIFTVATFLPNLVRLWLATLKFINSSTYSVCEGSHYKPLDDHLFSPFQNFSFSLFISFFSKSQRQSRYSVRQRPALTRVIGLPRRRRCRRRLHVKP